MQIRLPAPASARGSAAPGPAFWTSRRTTTSAVRPRYAVAAHGIHPALPCFPRFPSLGLAPDRASWALQWQAEELQGHCNRCKLNMALASHAAPVNKKPGPSVSHQSLTPYCHGAGPPGSAGFCSGECCPAANGTCVTNHDTGYYNCCAPSSSCGNRVKATPEIALSAKPRVLPVTRISLAGLI
jgi:hypothetical protein